MERLAFFFEQHMVACSIKSLVGVDCPGCGMQRALVALLRGNFIQSLSLNPALIPLLFTLLFASIHLAIGFRNGARVIVWLFSVTVSLMIVNFVVKSTLAL